MAGDQGDRVISFADMALRLRRRTFEEPRPCKHLHVEIDREAGTVECTDCGHAVSAFHVLSNLADRGAQMVAEHRTWLRRAAAVRRTLAGYKPRLRAAKELESAWRGRMLPCCPHCDRGLLPEDFADGATSSVGRDYELARRKREKEG